MPEAGGIHPTLLQNKDSSSPREPGGTTDGQAHTLRLGTAVVRIRSSLACSVLGGGAINRDARPATLWAWSGGGGGGCGTYRGDLQALGGGELRLLA